MFEVGKKPPQTLCQMNLDCLFHRGKSVSDDANEKEKNEMARPKIQTENLREKVDCYLSQEEKIEIEKNAKKAGLPLSVFLRKSALGQIVSVLPSINAKHWSELARVVSNLNQLAHQANSGFVVGVQQSELEAISHEVQALRLSLLGVIE